MGLIDEDETFLGIPVSRARLRPRPVVERAPHPSASLPGAAVGVDRAPGTSPGPLPARTMAEPSTPGRRAILGWLRQRRSG